MAKSSAHYVASVDPNWYLLLVAIVSVLVAFAQYRKNLARERSADYLRLAVEQFERAHAALQERQSPLESEWKGLPEPDRLVWLTAARMLRTGEKFGQKITEPSHHDSFANARSYWRSRLYELLEGLDRAPLHYFAERPEHIIATGRHERLPISDKSLKVVIDFLKWPDTEEDPLQGVPSFTDEQIEKMEKFEPRGLGNYLEAMRAIKQGPEDRRASWRAKWPKRREGDD